MRKKLNRRISSAPNIQDTPFILGVTTTSKAKTFNIASLGIREGKSVIVDWGQGTPNTYTGTAARAHTYTTAATFVIRIYNRRDIISLSLDKSGLGYILNVTPSNPMPIDLTSLTFTGGSSVNWTVGPGCQMPSNLVSLFATVYSPFIWKVNSNAPMPKKLTSLTIISGNADFEWHASRYNPIPENIEILSLDQTTGVPSSIVIPAEYWTCNKIQNLKFSTYLVQAQIDDVLRGLWLNKANFVYANPVMTNVIAGRVNELPSGINQAGNPPTTGLEYLYELRNTSSQSPGNNWTIS